MAHESVNYMEDDVDNRSNCGKSYGTEISQDITNLI